MTCVHMRYPHRRTLCEIKYVYSYVYCFKQHITKLADPGLGVLWCADAVQGRDNIGVLLQQI